MKVWKKIKRVLSGRQQAKMGPAKAHSFQNVEIMHNTVISGQNTIGEYTYIGFNCIITSSTIGRYCSIANNVSIGIGEHKLNRVSTSSLFYAKPFETLTEGNCIIGNDVWLGSNVVIRRGVTIGDGAVVGANSFVNKDVMPFEIVGGNPARSIKMRFSDEKIRKLKDSGWWAKDFNEAKKAINELEKTGQFETDGSN